MDVSLPVLALGKRQYELLVEIEDSIAAGTWTTRAVIDCGKLPSRLEKLVEMPQRQWPANRAALPAVYASSPAIEDVDEKDVQQRVQQKLEAEGRQERFEL